MKPWMWAVGGYLLLTSKTSGGTVANSNGQTPVTASNPLAAAVAALQQKMAQLTQSLGQQPKQQGGGGGGTGSGAGPGSGAPAAGGGGGGIASNQLSQFINKVLNGTNGIAPVQTPSTGDIAPVSGPGDFQIAPVTWDGSAITDNSTIPITDTYSNDYLDPVSVDPYQIAPVTWDGSGITDNSGGIATIDTPSTGDLSYSDWYDFSNDNYWTQLDTFNTYNVGDYTDAMSDYQSFSGYDPAMFEF